MVRCHVALGGNLGPVAETFDRALERLADRPGIAVIRRSAVYRTRAIGAAAEGEFRNAAAEIETRLSPLELLETLHAVESAFGRTRETRWGSRTLDLDLVFHGDAVIHGPRLTVPHPACWYRRFVLDPLCEIAAETVHPEKGVTVADLRFRLLARPLRVGLVGGDPAARARLAQTVAAGDRRLQLDDWDAADPNRAFVVWLGPVAAAAGDGAADPGFDALPRVPRLDLSRAADPARALRGVLDAALDEPVVARAEP